MVSIFLFMKSVLKNGKHFHIAEGVDLSKSGVYRVTFSNGAFYFGSSGNFKPRINLFRCQFNGTYKVENKKMVSVMAVSQSAIFEVVLYESDFQVFKSLETELIKSNYYNPLLINRSYSDVNTGVKWTEEEKKKMSDTVKMKIRTGITTHKPWEYVNRDNSGKKVVILKDGVKVDEFPSLKKAAAYIGSAPDSINNQMKGKNKKKHHKDYTFMFAKEYHEKFG